MTADLNSKSVMFQGLNPAVAHALREHLHDVRISNTAHDTPPPDLILTTGAPDGRPGIPCLRITPQARVGQVLADIRRALDEPALAVMPFALADAMFYPAEKKLERQNADDIPLTERETMLLLYLARHAPHAVAREAILRDVWRYQDGTDTHTLETHIYRLRQKIEAIEKEAPVLLTTGEGYCLSQIGGIDAAGTADDD